MKFLKISFILLFVTISALGQEKDSLMLRKIYDEALANGHSYKNLEYLCKKIGPRLSGSENAQKAVEWGKKLMQDYGFDKVYLQEVSVPHWIRGEKEEAYIIEQTEEDASISMPVPVAALGGSPATPEGGLTAEVIEVKSLDELARLGIAKIKGKVVFFNRAFDPRPIEPGNAYGMAGDQRFKGPAEAAKYGAVAAIVRSLTHAIDDYPHTGSTAYADNGSKIPAAAISTKAANELSDLLKKKAKIKFQLKMNCQTLPDVISYNVIGEIKGSEKPDEIITVGGHLDAWDLAEGAHDDGTGVVQSIETLRMLKTLGYKPKHTIRAVLFMNEENGLRGGKKYAELAKQNGEKHIVAIESDSGGFTPRGFSLENSLESIKFVNNWKPLLAPYGLNQIGIGESGADIGPLKNLPTVPVLIGFDPDRQRYFDVHHSSLDVFESVNRRELELGGASIAGLVYLIDQYGLGNINK